jgi:SEC-C motif
VGGAVLAIAAAGVVTSPRHPAREPAPGPRALEHEQPGVHDGSYLAKRSPWGVCHDSRSDLFMGAAKVERNKLCPCGSGVKYKRCHDPAHRQSVDWPGTYRVQPRLIKLLLAALDLLAENAPRKLNVSVGEDRYNQECVAVFHASMLHSAASAVGTLISHGLVREAFGLRRKMLSALVSLQYYIEIPGEATLFIASQPVKRYRTLSVHADLSPEQKADLHAEVVEVLSRYPEVGEWKPDGSLKQIWNEKADSEKRESLFPSLNAPQKATAKLILDDLPSQELHNTAFSIGNAIDIQPKGNGDISIVFNRKYPRGNYLLRESVYATLMAIDLLLKFRSEPRDSRSNQVRLDIDLFDYDEAAFKD